MFNYDRCLLKIDQCLVIKGCVGITKNQSFGTNGIPYHAHSLYGNKTAVNSHVIYVNYRDQLETDNWC